MGSAMERPLSAYTLPSFESKWPLLLRIRLPNKMYYFLIGSPLSLLLIKSPKVVMATFSNR